MGKVTMAGTGGSADLDVITAAANDVLAGKVIVGPDGESLTGTLALTGTAADSQVLAGQTYYNTDAKTKRTGAMLTMGGQTITPGAVQQTISCAGRYMLGNIVVQGVQKYAVKTGTYTPSAQTKQFKIRDSGGTVNLYYIRISNLGFTPTGFTAFRYYEERDYSVTASYGTILVQKRNGGDSCSQYALDRGDFSSTALDIPVWGIGTYYNVIIYGYF